MLTSIVTGGPARLHVVKHGFGVGATVIGFALLTIAGTAAAHTEADLVAVAAGEEATITLLPTHGCGDSPTITVSVRAPVEGAAAEAVDGWTATSAADGQGNTVLEWSGGLLPADAEGSFPVVFLVPDAVGTLLTFPAVQRCENGEELAWISGDPNDEFPAPRLLILAQGSSPAATIDDVPDDASGRDQLVAVVDVDNPNAPAATTPADTVADDTGEPTATTEPGGTESTATGSSVTGPTATEPTVEIDDTVATSDADETDSDDGGSTVVVIAIVGVIVAVLGGAALAWSRSRKSPDAAPPTSPGSAPPTSPGASPS